MCVNILHFVYDIHTTLVYDIRSSRIPNFMQASMRSNFDDCQSKITRKVFISVEGVTLSIGMCKRSNIWSDIMSGEMLDHLHTLSEHLASCPVMLGDV